MSLKRQKQHFLLLLLLPRKWNYLQLFSGESQNDKKKREAEIRTCSRTSGLDAFKATDCFAYGVLKDHAQKYTRVTTSDHE